jgi:Cu(I)/Ag(I) efflux system membrane protein CusA/SilA
MEQLVAQMNRALDLPGVSNAWTMPIKARLDMLTTGIRTPLGLKVTGADLRAIEEIGTRIEALLPSVPGTRSVFAERAGGGFFLDVAWRRDELARYGLSMDEAQAVVQSAIGGENVTTTVEGLERYAVNVRYMRDFRSDLDALSRVLVPASGGERQIPLGRLASIEVATGPAMIRDEDGLLASYVFVDVEGRDLDGYVREADRLIRAKVALPPGYAVLWSGQYEAMARVRERLAYVVPLTLLLVFLLLYLNTRSLAKTVIVALAVPFSAIGAVWYLYLLGYQMSVAVWVGLIALMGIDAETGVFMLLYLDLAYEKARREGRLRSLAELRETVVQGAAKRLRPKFMTVATTFVGFFPIMWATGTGSDVWKRIAAPMVGGIFTSFLLELVVYPAIYELWKWHLEVKPALAPKTAAHERKASATPLHEASGAARGLSRA